MSEIFPASTVVLVRGGGEGLEVLLLRRNQSLSFAGGLWVFPGGRIDPEDYIDGAGRPIAPEDIERAARFAAVRETREETGLAINEADLEYFSHWTTPAHHTKRFATWFYIAPVIGDSDQVKVCGSEIVEHRWCTPQAALADQGEQLIEMMPPTFVTLTELSKCETVAQTMAYFREQAIAAFEPRLTKTDAGIAMLYFGDAGYETMDQDAAGPRHRVWKLDKGWRYEKDL